MTIVIFNLPGSNLDLVPLDQIQCVTITPYHPEASNYGIVIDYKDGRSLALPRTPSMKAAMDLHKAIARHIDQAITHRPDFYWVEFDDPFLEEDNATPEEVQLAMEKMLDEWIPPEDPQPDTLILLEKDETGQGVRPKSPLD